MVKNGKRISKKQDPWYNKWLHYGKRLAAGAAGGAAGFIYHGPSGAYSGARSAWHYVGKYKRPIRAILGSNRYPNTVTGSNRGHVLGSNPGGVLKGKVGVKGNGKLFHPNVWHRPGVKYGYKKVFFSK